MLDSSNEAFMHFKDDDKVIKTILLYYYLHTFEGSLDFFFTNSSLPYYGSLVLKEKFYELENINMEICDSKIGLNILLNKNSMVSTHLKYFCLNAGILRISP